MIEQGTVRASTTHISPEVKADVSEIRVGGSNSLSRLGPIRAESNCAGFFPVLNEQLRY